jgi:hypothetical protein
MSAAAHLRCNIAPTVRCTHSQQGVQWPQRVCFVCRGHRHTIVCQAVVGVLSVVRILFKSTIKPNTFTAMSHATLWIAVNALRTTHRQESKSIHVFARGCSVEGRCTCGTKVNMVTARRAYILICCSARIVLCPHKAKSKRSPCSTTGNSLIQNLDTWPLCRSVNASTAISSRPVA